jgi:hypothetical protein
VRSEELWLKKKRHFGTNLNISKKKKKKKSPKKMNTLPLRSVSSLNSPQNNEMKFCEIFIISKVLKRNSFFEKE